MESLTHRPPSSITSVRRVTAMVEAASHSASRVSVEVARPEASSCPSSMSFRAPSNFLELSPKV